jgi:hypothetical protein
MYLASAWRVAPVVSSPAGLLVPQPSGPSESSLVSLGVAC